MSLRTARLSARDLGCGNHLDEIRLENLNAQRRLIQIFGAREVVKADQQRRTRSPQTVAQLVQLPGAASSADSTSRSTIWQPASAAANRTSSSAFNEPVNRPPKLLAAGKWPGPLCPRWAARNSFTLGRIEAGLASEIQAELEKPGIGQGRCGALDSAPPARRPESLRTACRGWSGASAEGGAGVGEGGLELKKGHMHQLTHLIAVLTRIATIKHRPAGEKYLSAIK